MRRLEHSEVWQCSPYYFVVASWPLLDRPVNGLAGIFGIVALLLAEVGPYSVAAYGLGTLLARDL